MAEINNPRLGRRRKNRGISSLIDVMALSVIIVIAISFMLVYSQTHSSQRVKDIKDTTQDMYSENALRTLSYVTAKNAGYWTVQPDALEEVSDKDLEPLVDLSLDAREYLSNLDGTLQNWESNISQIKDNISGYSSEVILRIEDVQSEIAKTRDTISQCETKMQGISTVCSNVTESLKNYTDIMGGTALLNNSCEYIDGLTGQITETSENLDQNLSKLDQKLGELKNTLNKINNTVDENAEQIIQSIKQARCILNEVNVKMDNYVTYIQLGVKANTTLIDLLPNKAPLETVPVTKVLGESLYVEDRLAQSDLLRAGGAMAARIALGESNQSDVEEECNKTKSKCPACAHYVNVEKLNYDAGGPHQDDRENLTDEYVTLKNTYDDSCDLTDWKINDNVGRTYRFGKVTLRSGNEITLHSGNGTDNETDLYWNSNYKPNPAIWNNDGDTMEITYKNLLLIKYTYDGHGNNQTEKYCPPAGLNNATNCSNASNSLSDAKNQIIQGIILTLIRKDYRKQAEDAVTAALDETLTKQGYEYCFKAQTCCEEINQVTAGNCTKIPDNAGTATRDLQMPGKQQGKMTLYIWR